MAGFEMVDHDIDRRDLDTVEQPGHAFLLLEREVVGEYLDAGARQRPKLRGPGSWTACAASTAFCTSNSVTWLPASASPRASSQ